MLEDNIVFQTQNVYFCKVLHYLLEARNAQVTFADKPQMKININKQNHAYLSVKTLNGTVLNWE